MSRQPPETSQSTRENQYDEANLLPQLLIKFTLRHWLASWKETLVLLLLLAVGVGSYLSIRIANRTAITGFESFTQSLTGGTSDGILSSKSGILHIEDLLLLREKLGSAPVLLIPVLEDYAVLPAEDTAEPVSAVNNRIQLVGLDLISIRNLEVYRKNAIRFQFGEEVSGEANSLFDSLHRQRSVFVDRDWADSNWLEISDRFPVLVNDRKITLQVSGFIPRDPTLPQASEFMQILDLPDLQEITGREGTLSRIEIIVEPGSRANRLRSTLRGRVTGNAPDHWVFETPHERKEQSVSMTRAFRLNLTILSLIALIVGLYLVLQALEAAVVRRRTEIATLRSLGVRRATLQRAWLMESLFLGCMGSALGIVLGWATAQFTVRAVARTVNTLYQGTSAQGAMLTGWDVFHGLLLGCGAGLIAGWIPAREASRTPPAQLLNRSHIDPGIPLLNRPGLGWLLIFSGTLFSFLPPITLDEGVRFPLFGYGAALFWLLGATLLLPLMIQCLAAISKSLWRESPPVFLASSRLRKPSGRHKLAAAGLLIAIGMANGMAILIHSFEFTMQNWIGHTLQADIYISSKADRNASSQARILSDTASRILENPHIDEVEFYRKYSMTIEGLQADVAGIDMQKAMNSGRFRFLQTSAPLREKQISWTTEPIEGIVSESFAERFRKDTGDMVEITMPHTGASRVKIAGVYADYGNERGTLLIHEEHIIRGYRDRSATGMAIHLKGMMDPDQVRLALSSEFPALHIQTNRNLRNEVLRIFRQTFSITHALKIIAVLVAVSGLGLGLTGLILEYRPDLTTLRALGMRRREMARVTAWEGALLTMASLLGGLLISFLLGFLLVHVINKQSFGWTLAFAIPWFELFYFSVIILIAGISVSWVVGYRGSRLPADREE